MEVDTLEISILKYLDILIGLTIVMILLSTVVAAVTQVINRLTSSRARGLRKGLTVLIAQIKPHELAHQAGNLADAVVRHPMICEPKTGLGDIAVFVRNILRKLFGDALPPLPYRNPGDVIAREELIRVLLEFAANEGPCCSAANQGLCLSPHVKFGRSAAIAGLLASTVLSSWKYSGQKVPSNDRDFAAQWLIGACYVLLFVLYSALWLNPGEGFIDHSKARVGRYISFIVLLVALGYATGQWIALPIGIIALFAGILPKLAKVQVPAQGSHLQAGENLLLHRGRLFGVVILAVLCCVSFGSTPMINAQPWAYLLLLLPLAPILMILAASPPPDWKQRSNILDSQAQQAIADGLTGMLKSPVEPPVDILPKDALTNYRRELLKLELGDPGMAAHVRQTKAVLLAVKGDFVGKINAWYDETMDRTTQQFAVESRIITVVAALLVAFAVQVDSLDLVRRLSIDDKFRQSLVDQAKSQQETIDKVNQSKADLVKACVEKAAADKAAADKVAECNRAATPGDGETEVKTIQNKRDEIQATLAQLRQPAMAIIPLHFVWEKVANASVTSKDSKTGTAEKITLVVGPKSVNFDINSDVGTTALDNLKLLHGEIQKSTAQVNTYLSEVTPGKPELRITAKDPAVQAVTLKAVDLFSGTPLKRDWDLGSISKAVPGIVLSWILLSLGAPFWYDMLKNSLKLRSTLARKEEQARDDRSKSEAQAVPPTATNKPEVQAG